ncbi:MAG: 1-deoxy-D-xylulose-5-phosphate reductoisomerase [Planctomycetota bacterium]
MTRIAVLGSTGSIGTSCLDVVRAHPGRFEVVAVAANRDAKTLAAQAAEFRVPRCALADAAVEVDQAAFAKTDLRRGADAVRELAALPEVDVVVAGIVGAAGLDSAYAAVEAGKRLALANKETMVVAGPLVVAKAAETGAEIIPVDSEHNAIFQALACGRREDVTRVVLTASGGPFRGKTRAELADVTPEQALRHPTWDMGRRITIDSATLANKALELIEAKWLFGLRDDQLDAVVHPQSVVHSFVEYVDGSVIAQLAPPDMKLPIQFAMGYPDRLPAAGPTLDWSQAFGLTFEPPDEEAFPALALGREVAARGGTCGAVFNAADEAAVTRFLAGELSFLDIPRVLRAAVDAHEYDPRPTLETLGRVDAAARDEVFRWSP